MAVSLVPVGPGVPPALVSLLKSHEDAILELQYPTQPRPLWSHPTAATLEATAPAADWPGTYALVADINSVVASTQVAGTWTWLRADGSAL